MDKRAPVVIVGAGISGLCCALHLQTQGLPVLPLEADEDVGGRVRTDRVDGVLLDRIPDALPLPPPGAFEPTVHGAKLSDRLFVRGDHRDLASLQGAMASGLRAAAAVAEAVR